LSVEEDHRDIMLSYGQHDLKSFVVGDLALTQYILNDIEYVVIYEQLFLFFHIECFPRDFIWDNLWSNVGLFDIRP
jgi:hypothetical protein